MVNAGAIVVLSLLLNLSEVDMSLAEKFDWVMNYFKVSSIQEAQALFIFLLILRAYHDTTTAADTAAGARSLSHFIIYFVSILTN